MNKIWCITLEADTGAKLTTCIEASSCSDALNEAFKKHGDLFPHFKTIN